MGGKRLSRREALVAGTALGGAAILGGCSKPKAVPRSRSTSPAAASRSTPRPPISLAEYANKRQLAGREDASAAFQDAVDALSEGDRLVVPRGSRLWFDGSGVVSLGGTNDITIDLTGSTIFKTTRRGVYAIFQARGVGTGYGSSARNIVIQGGRFEGSFKDGAEANLCAFSSNHGQIITIRDCEFIACMLGAGHTMDLGGCDNVTIEDCVWRGFKPGPDRAPRTEAVNIDISAFGTGADDPPYLDGLACRNVHLRRCEFLPYTDPDTKITYSAPAPLGSHAAREGQPFRNIRATKIKIVDPVVDRARIGFADNSYIRGLFHVPGVVGLWIDAQVSVSDGLGSCRVVQVQSASKGSSRSTSPNARGVPERPFRTPNLARDVHIDVDVVGMNSAVSDENPIVFVGGVEGGRARDIEIRAKINGASTAAVYVSKADRVSIDFPSCITGRIGARIESSTQVSVTGDFRNVTNPVSFRSGSTRSSFGPASVISSTPQAAVVECLDGSDFISAEGISAVGYARIFSTAPAHSTGTGNAIHPAVVVPTPR